ncbi:hypothetical protein PILCRDRAFT_822545 [Piloderma croceum F 1598]|uniref:DUF6533 domain-containing protein n=1 Tax=Piloderma croceum (strain F 1598) TaxID=765440 RepID=A0A0C3BST4_PILCF|nr:hypothetical protein PILCRDRAFT_822545 [Piloderma croceum F 1598]
MSAPSTTSYYPFDSEAPSVFRTIQMTNYFSGDRALLLYDHSITLDKEVEWIWTLRWRLPKIVFFVNRYLICLLIFCNFDRSYLTYAPVLVFCVTELLLVTRVCSLCKLLITNERLRANSTTITDDNGKVVTTTNVAVGYIDHFPIFSLEFVIWSLRGLLAGACIGGAVAVALINRKWYIFLYYKSLPGCWMNTTSSNPTTGWSMWTAFLSFEGVLMLLTAYKLFSYRNQMNQTVAMLARDSIIYFIIIFACLTLDIVTNIDIALVFQVSTPTECISSIAVP